MNFQHLYKKKMPPNLLHLTMEYKMQNSYHLSELSLQLQLLFELSDLKKQRFHEKFPRQLKTERLFVFHHLLMDKKMSRKYRHPEPGFHSLL